MEDYRVQSPRTIHEEREAYFAGEISAQEYLRRALPAESSRTPGPVDHNLSEQFRRILARLGGRDGSNGPVPGSRVP